MIRQAESSECGLACLAMVLGYHGLNIDISILRKRFRLSSQGASLKSLLAIAERLDLHARPLQLEMDELVKLRKPAILHWDFCHFVVLKRAGKRVIEILDPARGKVRLSRREAGRHFTGVALELVPLKQLAGSQTEKPLGLMDLWSCAEGVGVPLLYVFVLSVLLQLFMLSMPFYTQIFIDDVLVNYDFGLLKVLAIGFLLLVVIKACTELIRSLTVLYLGSTLGLQLGILVCHRLYQLKADYFGRRHIGDIVSRFSSVNQIKSFLASGGIQVLIDGLMVLSTLILMSVYSLLLTGISLLGLLLYVALRILTFGLCYQNQENVLIKSAQENTRFIENVRGIQSIKLFARESERLRSWQNTFTDSINAEIKQEKLNISLGFINNLLRGTENIVLIWIGAGAVMSNALSIGMLLAFISFKDQFYSRVFAFTDSLFEIRLLKVHLSRLSDIVLQPTEDENDSVIRLGDRAVNHPQSEALLQLHNLSYRYADFSPAVFSNINLAVFPGESIAIIGPSGCGKSTLLKLLMALLQPDQGEILYKGRKLLLYGLRNYRLEVGAVLQDDELLSGSLVDNISFFEPDPDLDRVQKAAESAVIHDEILRMPMQYETQLGTMGKALSGGQVQRLLLARALYKQPGLLILDEACSHLDIEKERAINAAIQAQRLTRIIVAHRPESIRFADRVYLLSANGLRSVDRNAAGVFPASGIAA